MSIHLRLDMPSHPRFLSVVRAAIDELSMTVGLPQEECTAVILAVDEALANIIRHAYKGHHDRRVQFDCLVDERQMEFTLVDQGVAPDLARICAPPVDELALSGRGTHLIKEIMDEVCYEQVPEGNQLRLIKRLPLAKGLVDEE
jgi:anti-sigma regulatory factor (Ser/Thr protein kinase)